jgi:hypothetical protein
MSAIQFLLYLVVAEDAKRIGLEKLDPATRAKAIAALAGLLILWFAVIALTWWGARFTRRYMRSSDTRRRRRAVAPSDEEWTAKPMVSGGPDVPPGEAPPEDFTQP